MEQTVIHLLMVQIFINLKQKILKFMQLHYMIDKTMIDKLVEEYSEVINGHEMVYYVTLNDHKRVCKSCTINIVLLVIIFIIIISINFFILIATEKEIILIVIIILILKQ